MKKYFNNDDTSKHVSTIAVDFVPTIGDSSDVYLGYVRSELDLWPLLVHILHVDTPVLVHISDGVDHDEEMAQGHCEQETRASRTCCDCRVQ